MTSNNSDIERAFELYVRLLREDPQLRAELEGSTELFFGGGAPGGAAADVLLAGRRHLEWFLFERHSHALLGVPAERLLERWRKDGQELCDDALSALLDSFAGMYEVGGIIKGEGCWLRDLGGFGSYALSAPAASEVMREGDVLVGRLYPIGDGLHEASLSAAIFRDQRLVDALQSDLQAIREQTGTNLLHVSQVELERMFWAAGRKPEVVDPEAAAREMLASAGVLEAEVQDILETLRQLPCPSQQLVHGPGDVLGGILDRLAFGTNVDLNRARRVLSAAWQAFGLEQATPVPEHPRAQDPTEPDPAQAMAAFDQGRAAGGDLDTLFQKLQHDLGIEGPLEDERDVGPTGPTGADPGEEAGADPGADPGAEAGLPGAIEAILEEFLWEVRETRGEATAASYGCLRTLAEYGRSLQALEDLGPAELLCYSCFWVHERGIVNGGEQGREFITALRAFCRWSQDAHEHPLERDFGGHLSGLEESLPRIADLNRMLDTDPVEEQGLLYEVVGGPDGRYAGLRDRGGIELEPGLVPAIEDGLRPGDHLRGSIAPDGMLRVLRCYPPQAAELVQ